MYEPISRQVIGSAIEVHRHLGPGLLESIYQACLMHELNSNQIRIHQQVEPPTTYKGTKIGHPYRIDLIVEQT